MASLPGAPRELRPRRVPPRTLAEVAEVLGVALSDGTPDARVTGVTHDSRAVRAGDLYAALPGARVHGARFAPDAAAGGAVAVVTDDEGAALVRASGAALPVLVVPAPRSRLGRLAAWVYGNPAEHLTTIGVTGTNGKTTTAYLLEAGFRESGQRTGLIGTIEIRIGDERVPSVRTTPEAPDLQALLAVMREDDVTGVAMEASSHALALGRVDGLVFDVAIFTNLGQDHLDFHADLEDYFQAKAALFTPRHSRRGVVNVDDPYGARLATMSEVPVVRVAAAGQDKDADWIVDDLTLRLTESVFTLRAAGGQGVAAGVRLPGAFNAENAALAVVALIEAGIEPTVAASGVRGCTGVPGRMERVDAGQPFLAVVDYAHTPDALEILLGALREVTPGRVTVVVGCGGDRDRGKRPAMGEVAARLADVAVLTTDNPRSEDPQAILDAVRSGAESVPRAERGEVVVLLDRAEAITSAVARARSGDAVVVAGKGHETGQEIAGVVHSFDDRVVLRRALETCGGIPT